MGSVSDFLEGKLLDHIFNAAYTPPGTVYLGLSTADPWTMLPAWPNQAEMDTSAKPLLSRPRPAGP